MEKGSDFNPIPPESIDSFRLDSPAEGKERETCKDGDDGSQETDDEEFEFSIATNGNGDLNAADEKHSDGKIRTIYPVFGRDVVFFTGGGGGEEDKHGEKKIVRRGPLRSLMVEEDKEKEMMIPSCSSSESDELEGLPADSYCIWTPGKVQSPDLKKKKKSKSTGISSRRWRLRDLVVWRSSSDGKKFLFFTSSPPQPTPAGEATSSTPSTMPEAKKEASGKKLGKITPAYVHQLYYVKGGDTAAISDQKRSFLPYQKDLVGIYSNLNGTSRSFHPF